MYPTQIIKDYKSESVPSAKLVVNHLILHHYLQEKFRGSCSHICRYIQRALVIKCCDLISECQKIHFDYYIERTMEQHIKAFQDCNSKYRGMASTRFFYRKIIYFLINNFERRQVAMLCMQICGQFPLLFILVQETQSCLKGGKQKEIFLL